jgi:hypothetical protein
MEEVAYEAFCKGKKLRRYGHLGTYLAHFSKQKEIFIKTQKRIF